MEVQSYGDAPLPDYGTTLLEDSENHLSEGRRVIGNVAYEGRTVYIRAPKWKDNVFWIKAPDYEAAQWIADAVYHYAGRPPFHFRRNFNYPPLLLGTGELLNSREKCSVHVAKIAKGPTLLSERGDYKERVKKLVLETVERPDVVQFLDEVRADRTPVEVDALSEEALRSLAQAVHVDAATMLRAADKSTFGDVNMSTAIVPSFGMDELENKLLSVGQNFGYEYRRRTNENPIDSNLPTPLDKGSQHVGEESVPVPVTRSSGEYAEWLESSGGLVDELLTNPSASCEEMETSARILTALAEELTYLRPGNRSRLGYDINMREWRVYWNELIAEMKTVDPDISSLGVYVLTTWPYPEFLRTLALRLCNRQVPYLTTGNLHRKSQEKIMERVDNRELDEGRTHRETREKVMRQTHTEG